MSFGERGRLSEMRDAGLGEENPHWTTSARGPAGEILLPLSYDCVLQPHQLLYDCLFRKLSSVTEIERLSMLKDWYAFVRLLCKTRSRDGFIFTPENRRLLWVSYRWEW